MRPAEDIAFPVPVRPITFLHSYARIFCVLFCLMFYNVPLYAQKGNWILKHYTTADGLPQNSVKYAAVDEKGFIWLGSENGIIRFDGQNFRIFNLSNSDVFSYTDRIGPIFANGKSHVYFNDAGFRTYEVKNFNTLSCISNTENEFLVSTNGALIRCNVLAQSIKNTAPPALQPVLIKNSVIMCAVSRLSDDEEYMFYDSIAYMRNGKVFKTLAPAATGLIINDTVYSLKGDHIVSSFYKDKYLGTSGMLTGDILTDEKRASLPVRIIPAGKLWLAAIGTNFYSISRAGGMLTAKLIFKDLTLPQYERIVYDEQHDRFIICTVSDGFYVLRSTPFDAVFGQVPAFTAFMNNFFAPVLLPGDAVPRLPDQPLFIDAVSVNNSEAAFDGKLKVPNDYSRLSISVTTPFFDNKKDLLLEYRLNDKKVWLPVNEDGRVELNRLAAGDYTLTVRKKGHFGDGYDYAFLDFEVLPAWYQTWWFKLSAVLVFLALILLGIRLQLAALLKRKRELERQIVDRTAQLTSTVQELSESQHALTESNKVKDTLVGLVLHDLRSPIRFMNTVITHISHTREKMPHYDFSEELEELKRTSMALNDFTDQFFLWISSQHEHFRVSETSFRIEDVLQNIKELYGPLFAGHRNECIIEPSVINCKTDKNILFAILRNLADNANKNTLDGKITFRAWLQKNIMNISVSDTGNGMSRERMNEIQRIDFALNNSQFGFRMIMDMAAKINASVKVESVLDKGTTITISIPQ